MKRSTETATVTDFVSTLYRGAFGTVELACCSGQRASSGAPSFSPQLRLVIPFEGSFLWHVGAEEVFADATKILFAGWGDTRGVSHPSGGDRSLVVTPSTTALEVVNTHGVDLDALLGSRWRRHSAQTQLAARMLHALCQGQDVLAIEAALLRFLRLAFDEPAANVRPRTARAQATLARAKEHLHCHPNAPMTLAEISRAAGVSPTYLTRLFTAAEGVSLHQYALKLRLSAALDAVSDSVDITHLALDLGFSSHSHLTSSFRAKFGMPPSCVRKLLAPGARDSRRNEVDVRPLWQAGEPA